MSGVFVAGFEILKKERNESQKVRMIEKFEWFIVSPVEEDIERK